MTRLSGAVALNNSVILLWILIGLPYLCGMRGINWDHYLPSYSKTVRDPENSSFIVFEADIIFFRA
ncbi:hypothetical protein HDF22_000805 [Mucilaginibacter lappiensis]|uniref:Uncharacterized protein n=1 Tax=Mucilaginibacter lappiensis TaxID=354630 RepID=A0A841J7G8_9SPHI|nr:hypothetical protein [Mucilaginibacter lappiensis]